jgi:hypothetical protein
MAASIPIRGISDIDLRAPGTEDFVVSEGETTVLSPSQEKYASLFARIRPNSLEEVKEIIGVPDGLHATSRRGVDDLSPALAQAVRERRREPQAINAFLNAAAKEFIFRDSESAAPFVPHIEQRLEVVVLVALIQDLTIGKNATLIIPREIDRLTVRNLTIGRGARLVIQGNNLLVYAKALRGESRPDIFVGGGVLTE